MKATVCIIDDDQGILDSVSMVLDDAGYTTEMYSDGKKALQMIHKHIPDIILLDLLLSGQDGREIYKNLKTNPKTKKIPVIVISAHHHGKKSITLHEGDEFLPKPFEREDLINLIEAHEN